MKNLPYGWIIFAYLAMVIFSFLYLTGLSLEPEEKHPKLIDKKWKRVLWLISCALFVPYLLTLAGLPSFLIEEIRKFISEGRKKNR